MINLLYTTSLTQAMGTWPKQLESLCVGQKKQNWKKHIDITF